MLYNDQISAPGLQPKLSQKDFDLISKFIIEEYGINISQSKRSLLEYRLLNRIKELGFDSYALYTKYLFSEKGQITEPLLLIDAVSTNKTEFFREVEHYNLLLTQILPDIHLKYAYNTDLHIWSAGCSSGEEVYSLAIILAKFKVLNHGFDFSVHGTDISKTVLQVAYRAIYPMPKTSVIRQKDLKDFFLVHKDPKNKTIRVNKQLRDKVSFAYLNLMDEKYKTPRDYPIIFCRNTLIYFNQENKTKVVKRLCKRLTPGGYLFISHTESLLQSIPGLKLVYPSVYQKVSST